MTANFVILNMMIKPDKTIEISAETKPLQNKFRENWEESFIKAGSLTDHSTIISTISNNFDDEEWTW